MGMMVIKNNGVRGGKSIVEYLLMRLVPLFALPGQAVQKNSVGQVMMNIEMRRLQNFKIELPVIDFVAAEILAIGHKTRQE